MKKVKFSNVSMVNSTTDGLNGEFMTLETAQKVHDNSVDYKSMVRLAKQRIALLQMDEISEETIVALNFILDALIEK